jgi:hypothetical protein
VLPEKLKLDLPGIDLGQGIDLGEPLPGIDSGLVTERPDPRLDCAPGGIARRKLPKECPGQRTREIAEVHGHLVRLGLGPERKLTSQDLRRSLDRLWAIGGHCLTELNGWRNIERKGSKCPPPVLVVLLQVGDCLHLRHPQYSLQCMHCSSVARGGNIIF